MPDLTCPTCGTELMEHENVHCLNEWLFSLFFTWPPSITSAPVPTFSNDLQWAWNFMDKVWELDPDAAIMKDHILLYKWYGPEDWSLSFVEGSTFPLRVCRAAIFLAARGKERK
jgi:hypothetical protein